MSGCRHTDAILDALLDPGASLSAGQRRHLSRCDACTAAADHVLELEDALTRQLAPLRSEPLPRTVLAAPPFPRRSGFGKLFSPTPAFALGAVTVLLAAVVTLASFQLFEFGARVGSLAPAGSPGSGTLLPFAEGGGTTSTPVPSATLDPVVTSGVDAAARVLASNPTFEGLVVYPAGAQRPEPELLSTYEAVAGGFVVTIAVGWSDCWSGCIYDHTWRFRVDTSGAIQLLEEAGDELAAGPGYGRASGDDASGLTGRVCAGPSPNFVCGGPSLGGAQVSVSVPGGGEVVRAASAPYSGRFVLELEPAVYVVTPEPHEGAAPPGPVAVSLAEAGAIALEFTYATEWPPVPGPVGEVVTDDLLVRSLPAVDPASEFLDELRPGTMVHVTDGPVIDTGYEWYRVEPADRESFEPGWVAAADNDLPETWLSLPEVPMLPGAECQPVRPRELPSGDKPGDVVLVQRDGGWRASWGSGEDAVLQFVGGFGGSELDRAESERATLRGREAHVVALNDAGGDRFHGVAVWWMVGDCRYAIFLAGLSVEETIEYAERF